MMNTVSDLLSGIKLPISITFPSPFAILIGILLILLTIYWLGTSEFAILKKLNVAGPKPVPFLGNLLDVHRYGSIDEAFMAYMKRYGKVFSICMGRVPAIVVADPEMIKEITIKEFSKFRNRSIAVKPPHPFDKQIGAASDETWKRIRTILTPTFSATKMKQMVPLMQESCDVLTEKLLEISKTDISVNVRPLMEQLALEILLSSAFGVTTNVQRNPDSEYIKKTKVLVTSRKGLKTYIQALPFQWLVRKLGSRMMGGFSQYFLSVAREIISKRKEHGVQSGRKDLMYLMLHAHEASGGSKLTDDEVAAQSVTFLINGYHTTSSFLSAIIYYLARNPEVQQNLYQDIEDALTANPDTALYDMVMSLKYLSCVIDETIRLTFPGGTQINRKCVESCTINGIYFPEGIEVVISQHLLHHDPHVWEDPYEYDPERFRDHKKTQRHPYQYIGFGSGPRICIGMRFAQLEIRLVLVRLLRKFKFVKSPKTAGPPRPGGVPEEVHLCVEKRGTGV